MQEHVTVEVAAKRIEDSLAERFGAAFRVDPELLRPGRAGADRRPSRASALPAAAGRARICFGSVRLRAFGAFEERLCSRPISSLVRDQAKQRAITALIPDMPWIEQAPAFLVFLANGRRLPEIARLRGKPFPNDHLDLFFNAVADSAIVHDHFHARRRGGRARLLPDQRDPRPRRRRERPARAARARHSGRRAVRGLARRGRRTSRRGSGSIPPCTRTAIAQASLARQIDAYDRRRRAPAPLSAPARARALGRGCLSTAGPRTRRGNTAEPLRADFGAFVRAKGFRLE